MSGNRLWVDEKSVTQGIEWYKNVINVVYNKFNLSNQKSLIELYSAWLKGESNSYQNNLERTDNEKKTINLGTVIEDNVTFSLSYYGNDGDISVIADGCSLPKRVSPFTVQPSAVDENHFISWAGLKAGENTLILNFNHANGETATYTVKVTYTDMHSSSEETSDSITDPKLQKAVCLALGKSVTEEITKEDMQKLTSLTARNVKNAEGIQYAVNLTSLQLSGDLEQIPDLNVLSRLTSLKLYGSYKEVPDLSGLTTLKTIYLDNEISNTLSGNEKTGEFSSPDLSGLTSLTTSALMEHGYRMVCTVH